MPDDETRPHPIMYEQAKVRESALTDKLAVLDEELKVLKAAPKSDFSSPIQKPPMGQIVVEIDTRKHSTSQTNSCQRGQEIAPVSLKTSTSVLDPTELLRAASPTNTIALGSESAPKRKRKRRAKGSSGGLPQDRKSTTQASQKSSSQDAIVSETTKPLSMQKSNSKMNIKNSSKAGSASSVK